MMRNNKKGFTIVELVIVIAVIAILAAVLIPTFSGVIDNASKSAAKSDARAAYTEYTYKNVENSPLAVNFIYEYDTDKFVVIKNGQIDETIYETRDAAKAVFNADTATVNCSPVETGSKLDAVTVTPAAQGGEGGGQQGGEQPNS